MKQIVYIHGLGVRDFKEIDSLSLEFYQLALLELAAGDTNRIALFQAQGLHHPLGEVNASLFGNKLEDTGMGGCCRVSGITKLEHPRGLELHVGKIGKRSRRHDD